MSAATSTKRSRWEGGIQRRGFEPLGGADLSLQEQLIFNLIFDLILMLPVAYVPDLARSGTSRTFAPFPCRTSETQGSKSILKQQRVDMLDSVVARSDVAQTSSRYARDEIHAGDAEGKILPCTGEVLNAMNGSPSNNKNGSSGASNTSLPDTFAQSI